jgi:hypothetical protein
MLDEETPNKTKKIYDASPAGWLAFEHRLFISWG